MLHIVNALKFVMLVCNVLSAFVDVLSSTTVRVDNFGKYKLNAV